jgi:hypothetical protein
MYDMKFGDTIAGGMEAEQKQEIVIHRGPGSAISMLWW